MKMHSTNHHDKVLGFGLLILSGAIVMATIVGGGGDADW